MPPFYQACLQANLTPVQYLTLQMLIALLQSHRTVQLEKLAALFAQPILFESRRRNLQRFLSLPQLSVKLLWFPLIKYILKQEYQKKKKEKKRIKKLKQIGKKNYLVVVIDRTEWKGRNLFVASVICSKRALPIYWILLDKQGSSNLQEQTKFLKPVLRLLKSYKIVVIGDREFQSVELGSWLDKKKVAFILRQKKGTKVLLPNASSYQALKSLKSKQGTSEFFPNIFHTEAHQLGPFNLAVRWKRTYRGQDQKETWYLLTNLESLSETLRLYKARFGIEAMFKDCKTGGYNLEKTKVNETRFLSLVLLIAIAYSLTILVGQQLNRISHRIYICRLKESHRSTERHSDFWIGYYGTFWSESMVSLAALAFSLMNLKPHKRPFFQKGLQALAFIHLAF